jgi:replication factor C subunit 3/5
MLLVDKYTPNNYKEIFFHKEIYERLQQMSKDNSIPHIIFHGPIGSGKRTMTKLFLKMIYGESIENLYSCKYEIPSSGSKVKIETVEKSEHHIIINPTETGFDRHLVHEIVKEYSSTKTIDLALNPNSKFRVIQISNLDKLSQSAQTSLRQIIEKNASTCRFIMWCNNLSKVILPLQSRCVLVRVPRPNKNELYKYLVNISAEERKIISPYKLSDIINYSKCNIKDAIWCVDYALKGYNSLTNYNMAIDKIVRLIFKVDMGNIETIRNIFFNMTISNYNTVDIIKSITNKILENKNISETCKINIILQVSNKEHRILKSRRKIIPFDALLVKIMQYIYNDNLENTSSDIKKIII